MVSLRSIVPALALAIPLAAGTSSGCKDSDGSISKDNAGEAAAETLCDLYFECNCPSFTDPDRFSSLEQCLADQESEVQGAIDEGDAAGLTYDGECVSDVLDTFSGLGCKNLASLQLDETIELIESLQCKLFYGDGEGGAPCEALLESNGDDCIRGFECVAGTCTAYETYAGPGQTCETEYFSPCSGNAICIDLSGDGDNRCEILPGTGDTCLGAPDLCSGGLTCEQATKTCDTAPAAGEACAQGACATGAVCDPDMTCQQLPGGGEDCISNECATGFACDAGVCAQQVPFACGDVI